MNGRAKVLAAAVGFGLVLAGCSSGGGGASAQASVAQAALRRAHETYDGSPRAVSERLRQAVWQKTMADGAD